MHVLLVEDEPLARRSIAAVLERAKYMVDQAENGEAALDLMSRGQFDAVIADYQLGGKINGIDVLRRHHAAAPGKQLILMTAFGSPEVESDASAIGAVYLEKPFRVRDLIEKIQRR